MPTDTELYLAREADKLLARVAEVEAALRPFANVVYNDNGDVTLSFSHLRQEDYMRARKALGR